MKTLKLLILSLAMLAFAACGDDTPEAMQWECPTYDQTEIFVNFTPEFYIQAQVAAKSSYSINLTAKMTVNDPATIENYYRFAYEGFPERIEYEPGTSGWQPMDFLTGTFKYEAEPIFGEHIGVFEAITGASDPYGFTFFTDRQFSGKSYTLTLQFDDMRYYLNDSEYSPELVDCGLELTLYSVSPSYYRWCVYRWHVDSGFVSDFGETGLGDPVWGYSNVSTGAGVVAAQTPSTYTLNLNEFLTKQIFRDK